MARITFIVSLLLMCCSCKVEPQPIDFGQDNCAYCTMTIVDRRYAAQYVSDKGKVAKFDAVECMIRFLEPVATDKIGLILCTDYTSPGTLLDATKASFLVSPEFPSPMGANLTAFKSTNKALETKGKATGQVYSWTEIKGKFTP